MSLKLWQSKFSPYLSKYVLELPPPMNCEEIIFSHHPIKLCMILSILEHFFQHSPWLQWYYTIILLSIYTLSSLPISQCSARFSLWLSESYPIPLRATFKWDTFLLLITRNHKIAIITHFSQSINIYSSFDICHRMCYEIKTQMWKMTIFLLYCGYNF